MLEARDLELRARWAPRVPREKIRRLYEGEARSLVDTELLDDVGMRLYLRCQSIALVRRIQHERAVYCHSCDELWAREIEGFDSVIRCPNCGREATWGQYWSTFRHKELAATAELLDEFMTAWERARSDSEKMLAVDRAIHRWHHENDPSRPIGRPWGVNLIEGSREQVIAFLDDLSFPPESAPHLAKTRDDWRRRLEEFRAASRPHVSKRQLPGD